MGKHQALPEDMITKKKKRFICSLYVSVVNTCCVKILRLLYPSFTSTCEISTLDKNWQPEKCTPFWAQPLHICPYRVHTPSRNFVKMNFFFMQFVSDCSSIVSFEVDRQMEPKRLKPNS